MSKKTWTSFEVHIFGNIGNFLTVPRKVHLRFTTVVNSITYDNEKFFVFRQLKDVHQVGHLFGKFKLPCDRTPHIIELRNLFRIVIWFWWEKIVLDRAIGEFQGELDVSTA